MATPTHAAVAAMHKVKTMKRGENARASVRMETSYKWGGLNAACAPPAAKKMLGINFALCDVFRKVWGAYREKGTF